jgi:hypothetical protein
VSQSASACSYVADNLRSAQGRICMSTFPRISSSTKERDLTHSRTNETKETDAMTIKTFLVLRNEAHSEPRTSTPHLHSLLLKHVARHVTLFLVLYIRFSLQSHTNSSLHTAHCPPHIYDIFTVTIRVHADIAVFCQSPPVH